ncbi:MAG: AMP phosphorylase [Candidatus Diapherotrites archaeon CG11_big_fil_rev_8_21_14_0_20_37_9]|nr:MAG: AMP phosphorylase [Candidatus Diapherotrites archaeon CG11_big_fil_rev_8_21_14_0_20_37_9]
MPEKNASKNSKPTSYMQRMKIKHIDIVAGKLIGIMNVIDAQELGMLPLDRAEIKNPKNGKFLNVVVDTTDSFVKEDEIGVFEGIHKFIGVNEGGIVEVKPAGKPKSLEFIKKKMNGEKLKDIELKQIVSDIASNRLSEIETTAFVSAVYMKGLDLEETVSMTKALIENGNKLDIQGKTCVDKHSVGGTNGRATMIIVPIIAAAGYCIPKTSSRSITSSAGTADAMEVLANVSLSLDEITKIVKKTNGCITWGGAVDLAPADDKIIKIEYPLSLDPEGQVIASVMAKKASVGAKFVVIDLPIGPYAKIKNKETAERMALKFIEVGKSLGIKVEVLLTNGSEPSGKAFGPALEAKYAMEILEGKFFDNLAQKSVELAGALLELVGHADKGKGFDVALNILESGKALEKMKEIIKAQGGKIFSSKDIEISKMTKIVYSERSGEISSINVSLMNKIARIAGAPANKTAGVMLKIEEGEKASKGQELFEVYSENERKLEAAYNFAKKNDPVELQRIILQKFS